jgi:hypothetical protein
VPERHWTGSTRGAAGPLSRPPVRRRAAQSSCALLLALFGLRVYSMRPSGRPPAVRVLWAPHRGAVGPGAHAPATRGGSAPRLQLVALSSGPVRMAYGPRPAYTRCFLHGPGSQRPGRSGRVLVPVRPAGGSSLPAGPPTPWEASTAALRSPARGLFAPVALIKAVPAPRRSRNKGKGFKGP